jgi:signal transduction histidine kinase/ActR/RegA family two-component response regulator
MMLSERVWFTVHNPAVGVPRLVSAIGSTIAIAIAYFLAARLSLALLEKADGVAVFWPAAGVASGVLIAFGPAARWPVIVAVMAATMGANLLGDRNVPSSLFFAVANAGEAALVAGLIQQLFGVPFELNNLARVLGLFTATITGTIVSGAVGTLGFILFHGASASIPTVWLHWFTSDALGTIALAPLVIGLVSLCRDLPPARELAEGALVLAVVGLLCGLLVSRPQESWTLELAIAGLCPLFVWTAARLRPAFTAAATFICAFTIVWATTFGIGTFGDTNLPIEQRILAAQATILATSFGALVLAALFSERRLHAISLLEREAKLQEALQAGGVIAFDWDVRTGEIRHSENAAKILGLIPKQVVRFGQLASRIHADDRPRIAASVSAANPDNPAYSATFRFAGPDGELWLEQVATVEFDSTGCRVGVRGLTTDITARKRFEQEISRAQRSAELADRAKSAFLAAASHDLRQPLQTLKFLQGALEQHHLGDEGSELVAGIGRSLDTMSGMLSSLLDVNRLESGNLRPARSDFAINEIFESVTTDFGRLIEEKGLRWRLVRSSHIIHSDRRMLEEMIRNLLSNAIRYTDHGRIVLGCRCSGDKVRIEVWDSGVGIAGDQLPHIFEEYYQGCESSNRGGYGLGLAIVKRLGEILQHSVEVRTTAGKGSGFLIEVPRGQVQAGATGALPTANENRDRFSGTVLIIEDETSVRSALRKLLKAKGMGVVGVATGNDAVSLISQHAMRPDLLLSDYNLPGQMNGVDSVKAVRAAAAWNVPAILMTGDLRSKTVEAISAEGMSVLVKPFSADELFQHIGRLHVRSES